MNVRYGKTIALAPGRRKSPDGAARGVGENRQHTSLQCFCKKNEMNCLKQKIRISRSQCEEKNHA